MGGAIAAAVYEVIHPMWSKESGADAGGWWRGCPAFWLAGELRRCGMLFAISVHRAVRDRFAGAKLQIIIVLCKKSASYQKGGAKDGWEFTALFGGYFSP